MSVVCFSFGILSVALAYGKKNKFEVWNIYVFYKELSLDGFRRFIFPIRVNICRSLNLLYIIIYMFSLLDQRWRLLGTDK